MWFALATVWADAPSVHVEWKGDSSRLVVAAPPGFEISSDAPADLTLAWADRSMSFLGNGAQMLGGVETGKVRGEKLEGELAIQLCDKASGVCSPATFALSASIPTAKKGQVALDLSEPDAHAHKPAFNTDAASKADEAFAAAKSSGDLVLLDFSAVWCPPCNMLAAEVLHADDAEEVLKGFQVAVLDVDHKSSWTLKNTYDVGSYPTVVVVDAEGTEKARLVGYESRDAFLGFLGEASEGMSWSDTDPATLTPDEAARGMWSLLNAGQKEGLEGWIAASKDSESEEAHLARFATEPNPSDATWLTDNAPEKALSWVFESGDWGETDEAKALLETAIRAALPRIEGPQAADLLYLLAQIHDDDPTLYAAAAATLKASFSGNDLVDRAHYTFLAALINKGGDPDSAVGFLDEMTRTHPDEPTFLLSAAKILNGHERHEEALKRTTAALTRAWGDNKLRVVEAHCKALVGLERADEARGFADKALHEVGPPAEDMKVRTHRYREKLAVFLEP